MPDENSTQVWTAQTPQNNQSTTNQSWDDFVLELNQNDWSWETISWDNDNGIELDLWDKADDSEWNNSDDDFTIEFNNPSGETEVSDNNGDEFVIDQDSDTSNQSETEGFEVNLDASNEENKDSVEDTIDFNQDEVFGTKQEEDNNSKSQINLEEWLTETPEENLNETFEVSFEDKDIEWEKESNDENNINLDLNNNVETWDSQSEHLNEEIGEETPAEEGIINDEKEIGEEGSVEEGIMNDEEEVGEETPAEEKSQENNILNESENKNPNIEWIDENNQDTIYDDIQDNEEDIIKENENEVLLQSNDEINDDFHSNNESIDSLEEKNDSQESVENENNLENLDSELVNTNEDLNAEEGIIEKSEDSESLLNDDSEDKNGIDGNEDTSEEMSDSDLVGEDTENETLDSNILLSWETIEDSSHEMENSDESELTEENMAEFPETTVESAVNNSDSESTFTWNDDIAEDNDKMIENNVEEINENVWFIMDDNDNQENSVESENSVDLWTENTENLNEKIEEKVEENIEEKQSDLSINQADTNIDISWEKEHKETDSQNIVNDLESKDSKPDQMEVWTITSTLSLDQILDSELQSNPQFADHSKSIPKNIQKESSFWSGKKVSIFAWLWVCLLLWIVVVLAFPSTSSERKSGDIVETQDSESLGEEVLPTEYVPEFIEETEQEETWSETQDPWIDWKTEGHWSWPSFEVVDEYEEDSYSEWKIKPYTPTELESEDTTKKEKQSLSMADIQPKISSLKSKGESYKNIGEKESNEKVVKYALYILRLCEEYEMQLDEGEWLDKESFSEFEEKVNNLISKIENNLGWPDEVETVYTQATLNNDEEKEEIRAYLEGNR